MSAVAVGSAHTEAVSSYLQGLQARITKAIADIDGTAFLLDAWQKPAGELLIEDGPMTSVWFVTMAPPAVENEGLSA